MTRLTPNELAEAITDFVNSSNKEKYQEFIQSFSNQHRTLQQSAFGMFLQLTEHMASDDYNTDGRNEDSKKVAIALVNGFKQAKKAEYISEGVSEARAEEYVSSEYGSKPSRYLGFI